MITVVIDKLEHLRRYKSWRYDLYHFGIEVLLERYVLFLEKNRLRGDVMAESRGGKEDMRLKKSFRNLYDSGTQCIEQNRFARVLTSKAIKTKLKSYNIAGLQLADLLAHPSRREILLENGMIKDTRKHIFAEKIVEIIQNKYNQQNGRKYGFGKNLLP